MYELGPADHHSSSSYFAFPCRSHFLNGCMSLCPALPFFPLCSLTTGFLPYLWGVPADALLTNSWDAGMGEVPWRPPSPNHLTKETRTRGWSDDLLPIKKLAPLLGGNPGAPIPITEFFLPQYLSPLLLLPSSFSEPSFLASLSGF